MTLANGHHDPASVLAAELGRLLADWEVPASPCRDHDVARRLLALGAAPVLHPGDALTPEQTQPLGGEG